MSISLRFCGLLWALLWRRAWQPTPVFLLENPMDRGVWQATVRRVTKSWTWLKQQVCTNVCCEIPGCVPWIKVDGAYLPRPASHKSGESIRWTGYGLHISFHWRFKIQRVNSLLPWPPVYKVPFIINLRLLIGQKNSLLPYPKGSQNLIAAALFVQAISV